MKNIKFLTLALFSLFLINCSNDDDGQVAYKGGTFLNFLNQGGEEQLAVVSNTSFVETVVRVGTFLPVSGSHTVKLVPIVDGSTAVLGVDYQIINDTDVLEDGETEGGFTLRFLKDPATESGKKVSFRLESDLQQASFNTIHTINIRLSCPVEVLVGDFKSTTYWYQNQERIHLIDQPVPLDGEGNPEVDENGNPVKSSQIIIRNFFFENTTPPGPSGVSGADFSLGFDTATFEILSFGSKDTGRFVAGIGPNTTYGGQIRATPTPGRVSKFNPCTRVVTLYVTYFVPRANNVAGFDRVNAVEEFTGVVVE